MTASLHHHTVNTILITLCLKGFLLTTSKGNLSAKLKLLPRVCDDSIPAAKQSLCHPSLSKLVLSPTLSHACCAACALRPAFSVFFSPFLNSEFGVKVLQSELFVYL